MGLYFVPAVFRALIEHKQDDGKATPSIAYELIRELQGDETEMTPDQDALARTVSGNSLAGLLSFDRSILARIDPPLTFQVALTP